MTKVYLLIHGQCQYEDFPTVEGVFSTETAAQAYQDRIDSANGYTKDNIQVISSIANRMKWNATKEQLLTFCKGVLSLEGRAGLL